MESLLHGQAGHQRHVVAGLTQIERVHLKVRDGDDDGEEYDRSDTSRLELVLKEASSCWAAVPAAR